MRRQGRLPLPPRLLPCAPRKGAIGGLLARQELALSLPSMLPSAHVNRVGVRVVSFRGLIPTPPILYLRFAGSLEVAAQDSMPSDSLLLSCKALSTQNPVYGPPNGCDELRGGGLGQFLRLWAQPEAIR
jgi:hypothetical protein